MASEADLPPQSGKSHRPKPESQSAPAAPGSQTETGATEGTRDEREFNARLDELQRRITTIRRRLDDLEQRAATVHPAVVPDRHRAPQRAPRPGPSLSAPRGALPAPPVRPALGPPRDQLLLPPAPSTAARSHLQRSVTDRLSLQLVLLVGGIAAWALGVSAFRPAQIGSYGLLYSATAWFFIGFAALAIGFVYELARSAPRTWLLGLLLAALIVAIHATVPIIYGTPEYDWVFKHVGITQSMAAYGRITDGGNIYQQWPLFFAASAAVSALGHIGPLTYATWAPLAFELLDALLLLAVFRAFTDDRRVAWLAVLLFEGVIAWVGQDYFSPQAFAFTLWLGVVVIVARPLRAVPSPYREGTVAKLRAPLLVGLDAPGQKPPAARRFAIVLLAGVYFAIVASHQLTPYLALAAVAGLAWLETVRPRWIVILLAVIAFGFLAPRYNLIAHNFGGLFSDLNFIANAAGKPGTTHAGAEATTALIVRALAAVMWLLTLAVIVRRRKTLGRVVVPAMLAFSPFFVLVVQSYGGEAIYRVFMFSAPWCLLLIAQAACELRLLPKRWPLVAVVSLATLFAGLQGLYGPVSVYSFSPQEVATSRWLYANLPRGSLIVLPVDDFPSLEAADYHAYDLQVMPSDPQLGKPPTLDERSLSDVEHWLAQQGHSEAYLVLSPTMTRYANYYGWPRGFDQLAQVIPTAPGWSLFHRDGATRVYRLSLDSGESSAAAGGAAGPPPRRATSLRKNPSQGTFRKRR